MKKYLAVIPFILLCLVVAVGWCTIVVNHYSPAIRNIAALVLILINLPLYFVRPTAARITTGLILLLATFSAIQLTMDIATYQFSVGIGALKISTPPIHWLSFFLLVFFCVVNASLVRTSWRAVIAWFNKDGI